MRKLSYWRWWIGWKLRRKATKTMNPSPTTPLHKRIWRTTLTSCSCSLIKMIEPATSGRTLSKRFTARRWWVWNFDVLTRISDSRSFQIYDIIQTFGELSEEAAQSRKYAKWKAAYIHNCLKNGETPHAGPMPTEGEDELQDIAAGGAPGPAPGGGWNTNPYDQPQAPYQPPAPFQPLPPTHYDPPAPASNSSLPFHLPDPPKDPEPKHPGGFIPYNPQESNLPSFESSRPGSALTPEQIAKAQKYTKYAGSALTYDDVPTAIENLQKCLRLLQTGQDS